MNFVKILFFLAIGAQAFEVDPLSCKSYNGEDLIYFDLYPEKESVLHGVSIKHEKEEYCGFRPCLKTVVQRDIKSLVCYMQEGAFAHSIGCFNRKYNVGIEFLKSSVALTINHKKGSQLELFARYRFRKEDCI